MGFIIIGGFVVHAAKIGDDVLKLGRPGSTNDKLIEFGTTQRIRANQSTNKIEFSDDGIGFKAIADIVANEASLIENTTIDTSVATNALTLNLKIADGLTDASSGSPSKTAFRDATSNDGSYNILSVTAALSIVIPSGATLGHLDGTDSFIYVYALDNVSTVELAVSSSIKDESSLQTSLTISTASDDDDLYSITGRSNVPIRLIARLKSNQVTAGTWNLDVIENTPGAHIFTDLTTSLNAKVAQEDITQSVVIGAIRITSPESCTVTNEFGNFVDSTTDAGTNICTLNLKVGWVTSSPVCVCSSNDGSGVVESTDACRFTGLTTSIVRVEAETDTDITVTCTGKK